MGGRAFPDSSWASRSTAERILRTLRRETGWDLIPVGSFSFRDPMPDVDLAVREDEFDRKVLDRLGRTRTYTLGGAGLRLVFEGSAYQIDFFPAVSLRWASFARAGAPDSGARRAVILKAAAATFEEPGRDLLIWRGDMLVGRAGRTLDQRFGLRRIFQHRLREDGRGFTRAAKTITGERFVELFGRRAPSVRTLFDPDVVSEMILGSIGVDGSAAELERHVVSTFSTERARRVARIVEDRGFAFSTGRAA